MFKLRILSAVVLMILMLSTVSARAHHSFQMFDRENPIKISGEIKEFQWVNPHTWIQIYVTDNESNEVVEWSIEGRSPNQLARRDWTRNTVMPGELVTLTIYPLRSGLPGGSIATVEKADGTIINADSPTAADPIEEGQR